MRSLYLVRHGVAAPREEYHVDGERPLTAEGVHKTQQAARGFAALARVDVMFTSPLVRAAQTAELFADALEPKPAVEPTELLAFAGQHDALLKLVNASNVERIALVGHEPDMGNLTAALLGGAFDVDFKKAGACRIDFPRKVQAGQGRLVWFLPPRALRALANC